VIVIVPVEEGEEVLLEVEVRDGVSIAVGVDKPVIVLLAEGLDVSLDVREGLAPTEIVGDDEAVTLEVREASGKPLAVLLPVEVKVSEPDEEAVGVRVDEGVLVAVLVAVALEESEMLDVIEAEAPFETDPVGVRDIELERL